MARLDLVFEDPCWQRLADHERPQCTNTSKCLNEIPKRSVIHSTQTVGTSSCAPACESTWRSGSPARRRLRRVCARADIGSTKGQISVFTRPTPDSPLAQKAWDFWNDTANWQGTEIAATSNMGYEFVERDLAVKTGPVDPAKVGPGAKYLYRPTRRRPIPPP